MSKPNGTLAELARRIGVTDGAIAQGLSAGRVPSAKRVRGRWRLPDLDTAEREWRAHTKPNRVPRKVTAEKTERLLARAAELEGEVGPPASDDAGVSMVEAQRRYEVARARKMELDLGERDGTLHDVDACRAQITTTAIEIRDKILAVPAKLRQRFHSVDRAVLNGLDELLREALEALADAAEASPE